MAWRDGALDIGQGTESDLWPDHDSDSIWMMDTCSMSRRSDSRTRGSATAKLSGLDQLLASGRCLDRSRRFLQTASLSTLAFPVPSVLPCHVSIHTNHRPNANIPQSSYMQLLRFGRQRRHCATYTTTFQGRGACFCFLPRCHPSPPGDFSLSAVWATLRCFMFHRRQSDGRACFAPESRRGDRRSGSLTNKVQ